MQYEILPKNQTLESSQVFNPPEDILSPEQRLDAIAEILAAIALRSMRKREQESK